MRSSVGLREFRASLADYVASGTPVAVTRHGQTVGWFIPTPGSKAAEVASLREGADAVDHASRSEGTSATASADPRVFLRDVKPYAVPASLNDLAGPATGELVLPHSVMWAPGDGRVDLDVPGARRWLTVRCSQRAHSRTSFAWSMRIGSGMSGAICCCRVEYEACGRPRSSNCGVASERPERGAARHREDRTRRKP